MSKKKLLICVLSAIVALTAAVTVILIYREKISALLEQVKTLTGLLKRKQKAQLEE